MCVVRLVIQSTHSMSKELGGPPWSPVIKMQVIFSMSGISRGAFLRLRMIVLIFILGV